MIWKKISIDTSLEAVDLISEFLDEQGIEGIMIEDNQPLTEDEIREMFVDIPLVGDASDDSAVVSFFIDSSYTDKMIDDLADKIRAELKRLSEFIPVGTMNIDMTETSDDSTWNDNFKNFFKPQRLYGNLVIMPVYDDDMNSDSNNNENNDLKDFDIKEEDKVIKIRSVMAFGTGTHETTRLCLGLIKKHINDMSTIKKDLTLMDVGCGSGILSIASVLLGASFVHGLDIDPQAVEASKINADVNGIKEDKLLFSCGNLLAGNMIAENYINNVNSDNSEDIKKKIEKASLGSGISSVLTPEEAARMVDIEGGTVDSVPKRKYDIVVANILADVIIPLSSVIEEYMEDGGVFIASGISESRIDDVKIALMNNGFTIIDSEQENEWFALAAVRN
ncbi:MAG TPA: 50S ribosomal protein L11 methyltransferase [Lachnospiraceae bacterium]|nr:50S ribosomal protein L11 methyltransferase [Lachnospiraceae bacterium]